MQHASIVLKNCHNVEKNVYIAEKLDPRFYLNFKKKSRYYKYTVQISAEKKAKIEFFSEHIGYHRIVGFTDGKIYKGAIRFSEQRSDVRIDPSDCNGEFTVGKLNIAQCGAFYYYLNKGFSFSCKIMHFAIKNPKKFLKIFHDALRTMYHAILSAKNGLIHSMKNELHRQFASDDYTYIAPRISRQEIDSLYLRPLISVVMPTYNIDPKWLNLAISSVEAQAYDNWELSICDDGSTNKETLEYLNHIDHPKIKVDFLEKNSGISAATNKAIQNTSGDYIVFMDNDDEITSDALYEIVKAINEKEADFIYSDEDFLSGDVHINPHFKSDFNPDLLLSHNYITHLVCVKKEIGDKTGWLRSEYDGAQDYDFVLRATEVAKNIVHIPKVLYHWRIIETSTTFSSAAKPKAHERGYKALRETIARRGIKGFVLNGNATYFYRVKRKIIGYPKVSIIIPFKDAPELLEACIYSILSKTTYQSYEIIGINNNSTMDETFVLMKELEVIDERIRFHDYKHPFNYSKINNYAVENYATGEHLILLNNDIEIISPDWIEAMLEHSQRDEVGAVGAKLYYEDNTIQHAGVIIGIGGAAGHAFRMFTKHDFGYFNRAQSIQNLSAVTAAALMVKRSLYQEVNGLEEENLTVAFNDVDFCLRLREKGCLNVYTPYAEMYHYESKSRGYEVTTEKRRRFDKEKEYFVEQHKEILVNGDPYYNKNLTLIREDFSLE